MVRAIVDGSINSVMFTDEQIDLRQKLINIELTLTKKKDVKNMKRKVADEKRERNQLNINGTTDNKAILKESDNRMVYYI